MRRAFLVLLLILAAAAIVGYLMQLDAGYVLIDFHGTSIESTVWVTALIVAVSFVAFYGAGRALALVADLIARLRGRSPRRSLLKSLSLRRNSATVRGALALQEGRFKQAVPLLARGARESDAPFLNYLLAARAGVALEDAQLADGFLQLAADTPDAAVAVAIARAEAECSRGDYAAALQKLESVRLDHSASPAALRLLLEVLEQLQAWARIGQLLPEARKLQVLSQSALDALEERTLQQLLPLAGADRKALQATWKAASNRVREGPALVAAYAQLLARSGAAEEAEGLLAAALKRGWDDALIRAYGLLAAADPRRQLSNAEAELQRHPRDATLLLALGRIALRNRLWGKARDYFEASLAARVSGETCAELARLCLHLGEPERSRLLLQQAVAAELGELPVLPMPDKSH